MPASPAAASAAPGPAPRVHPAVYSGNHVCSIWQPCARDSCNKIAVSAHGIREVQTLAFAVHDGRDVLLRNISPEIDPTLEGARRWSTASARSEAEPRTRTTARPLVSAARCSRPSRSPPAPEHQPLPSVDVSMVGKTRQAGERPRRCSAPNSSQWNDQRPRSWPPRLGAASLRCPGDGRPLPPEPSPCRAVSSPSSTGAENQFQVDDNGHVGCPCEVSLAPPYPELFASYGASTVTRTSGRGHVAEAKTKVIEVSGF
jgi:hypothetical protein